MTTPKLNKILAAALGLQVLLVGFAWMPSASSPTDARDLVPTEAAQLDKITIYGRTARDEVPEPPTILVRESDGWKIESSFDYPAEDELLEPLFEAIDSLVARRPVATQTHSHYALDVADDQHMNKFLIEGGGESVVLLLGAAEGRAAHVRLEGEEEVYKVRGFSVAGLPYRANRIFDRNFIKVPVDDVSSLTIERPGQPPIQLSGGPNDWTMAGLADGQMLDPGKTRGFVQTAVNLRMLEPHGTVVTPEMGLESGIVVTWTTEENGATATHEYRVGNDIQGKDGRTYLKVSHLPWVFELLKGNVQHARDPKVEALISDAIDIDGLLDD